MSEAHPRQIEHVGWGALAELAAIVERVGPRHVLLVAGRTALTSSGAADALAEAFRGVDVVRFADFSGNPKAEEIESATSICLERAPDLIVAVGGGTAIDLAKGVRAVIASDASLADLLAGRPAPSTDRRIPLVAVPTTSGTGSEATQFAVVYVNGTKQSLDHPSVRPDVAIVDPALTLALPPSITAATGMDALSQAMESIWSVASDDESQPDAEESLRLSLAHLRQAVVAPTRADREAMSVAAHLAGRAIDRTRTTAAHAASYPITSRHGIPHGHAVALTLPHMLVFNSGVTDADVLDPRGAGAVRDRIALILSLLGASDPEDGRRRLLALTREIGLATSLRELGIEEIEPILDQGFTPSRVRNNPRRVTREDLEAMLRWAPAGVA